MQKNDLIIFNCCIHRILNFEGAKILVIDCEKRTMPIWFPDSLLYNCKECTIEELQKQSGVNIPNIEQLSIVAQKKIYERYSLIAPILALIDSENERSYMINRIAQRSGVSKQTIRINATFLPASKCSVSLATDVSYVFIFYTSLQLKISCLSIAYVFH